MIYVGIDVAKDKHDCFITNSDGEVLEDPFTIINSRDGFDYLFEKILTHSETVKNVKVGLEATGHYSYNLTSFLLAKGFALFVINPLHTSLYRKSLTLRKTKTDKVDSFTIAKLLIAEPELEPYSTQDFCKEELKSLTRYRFTKVQERSKLKTSLSRLMVILFPELSKMVPTLHMASIYEMLEAFPGAEELGNAHIDTLENLLYRASKGHYGRDNAIIFQKAARNSIGSFMPAKSLELRHTIALIRILDTEIKEIEGKIKVLVDDIDSPVLSVPGISYQLGAMILAEIGSFERFESPDKLLAYAGISPSTYQSGQLISTTYSHMEKRGSKYLRYALFTATKGVCLWDPTFAAYLKKKREEGKHYYVAISHATKKLVRVIFRMEKTKQKFRQAEPERMQATP